MLTSPKSLPRLLILLAVVFAALPIPSLGQEDLGQEDLVTKQLLEQSRRSNEMLAVSVASLARTQRWPEVDQLLSSLSKKKLTPAQSAAMAARIGSAVFLKIKQQPDVSDVAKANLDKLGQALTAEIESPERLVKAIGLLESPLADQRLAATRTLLGGGDAAIAQLANAAVADRSSSSRDEILKVMLRLGDGGKNALRQLALYGKAEVRPRAIESLGRIDAKSFIIELVAAYHATDATPSERDAAAAGLMRISNVLPGRAEAIKILAGDLNASRKLAETIDNDDQTRTVWNIGEDRSSVTSISTQAMLAAYRDAADAGLRLRRLATDSVELDAAMLSASLAYRVVIDPDWGDKDQIDEVKNRWTSAINEAAIMAAIEQTAVTSSPAALIGLIRLASAESAEMNADALVRSRGATATPLVELASSSNPRVRYEAALLVSSLAGDSPYAGSSRVRQTLAEMTRLGDRPTAIVLETRAEYATHFERLFGEIGWQPIVVQSAASLSRAIDRGGDLRLILSKIQISDLPPIEMVDLVRRAARGGDMPIVFYDDDGVTGASEIEGVDLGIGRWSAPIVLTDPPLSAAGLDGVLSEVELRRRLPALSVLDRQRFRSEAAEILLP